MNRKEKLNEKFKKEIQALKKGVCWVHGDSLVKELAEPSYGFPSGLDFELKEKYPFHALFVDMGCLASANDQELQMTTKCISCNKKARIFLNSIEYD